VGVWSGSASVSIGAQRTAQHENGHLLTAGRGADLTPPLHPFSTIEAEGNKAAQAKKRAPFPFAGLTRQWHRVDRKPDPCHARVRGITRQRDVLKGLARLSASREPIDPHELDEKMMDVHWSGTLRAAGIATWCGNGQHGSGWSKPKEERLRAADRHPALVIDGSTTKIAFIGPSPP